MDNNYTKESKWNGMRNGAQSSLQQAINFLGRPTSAKGTALPNSGASEMQRWLSLIGGGVLTIYGVRRSLFGLTITALGGSLIYRGLTGRWPIPETVVGNQAIRNASMAVGRPSPVTRSIIVHASAEQAYEMWSNFENFPQFMEYLESVRLTGNDPRTGEQLSHWVMRGPLNTHVQWDARTTRMEPNKRIAWNSTEGDIETSGQVTFNALPDEQTEITVTMLYVPPAGLAGQAVAQLFGDPEGKLEQGLRNFKRIIENRSVDAPAAEGVLEG